MAQEKLAQGEYSKNALNSAWQESIELYNEKNKHYLDLKIKCLRKMLLIVIISFKSKTTILIN